MPCLERKLKMVLKAQSDNIITNQRSYIPRSHKLVLYCVRVLGLDVFFLFFLKNEQILKKSIN